MRVGLVRSLQPPDILWIHWRVYNSIANTSKGVLFLPPSDVYVRSFLYPFYTLIKLYYTKALSDQAPSLAPDWILLLWRPRIPASFVVQQQSFTSWWAGSGNQAPETSSIDRVCFMKQEKTEDEKSKQSPWKKVKNSSYVNQMGNRCNRTKNQV